jgi:hypothetical protein
MEIGSFGKSAILAVPGLALLSSQAPDIHRGCWVLPLPGMRAGGTSSRHPVPFTLGGGSHQRLSSVPFEAEPRC